MVRNLTCETWVTIKDHKTKKTIWEGFASAATFNDEVKCWDFSRSHDIYI